jgi:hypothetical protein
MFTDEQLTNEVLRLKEQEEKGRNIYFKIKAIVNLGLSKQIVNLGLLEQEGIDTDSFSFSVYLTLKPVSDLVLTGDLKMALYVLKTLPYNIYCPKELIDFVANTIKAEIE